MIFHRLFNRLFNRLPPPPAAPKLWGHIVRCETPDGVYLYDLTCSEGSELFPEQLAARVHLSKLCRSDENIDWSTARWFLIPLYEHDDGTTYGGHPQPIDDPEFLP